jgi:hypothetical protein
MVSALETVQVNPIKPELEPRLVSELKSALP